MSRASDLANLIASGNTTIFGEAGVTSSDSTGKTTNLQQGLAKATLRGNTDAVLTNSFNISGGTDVATGRYTYSLTNSFSSVAYVQSGVVEGSAHGRILTRDTAQDEAGTIAVEVATSTTDLVDGIQDVTVHGDLA